MNKSTLTDAAMLDVVLDRTIALPLFEQLVRALRQIILSHRVAPGSKLPSTRKLASELCVSRVTIVTAYDQLTAEGYIESRHGSGAYVVDGLPDEILQVSQPAANARSKPGPCKAVKPFQPTSPDMRLFPHKAWAKLFQRVWSNPHPSLIANADPLGWWPLRQQICDHLKAWRGIDCYPENLIITSGASETMQIIADGLIGSGQTIACEDPGYTLFSHVLHRSHIKVQAVPVDEHGIALGTLSTLAPQPTCVITTPSRQYPLGITMPLTRRLQLLDWAVKNDRIIIEDDYDSEYRYVGQPLPALMSLAPQGAVIYLGSFSKVFSKSMRLGFMVVPAQHRAAIAAAISKNGPGAGGVLQPVLAQFMENGAYASHIRSMRRTYALRQKSFIAAADRHLGGLLEFEPSGGGMHLVGKIGEKLFGKISDVEICRLAGEADIALFALSKFYLGPNSQQGVLAGYAGFDENELEMAAQKLARILSVV